MRSIIYTLLSLATITNVLAADPQPTKSADDWEDVVPDTVFNGQTVPPMKEMDSVHIAEDISKGNWIVEFFSPHCPHCVAFRPTYQTLYEFYYTSKPISTIEQKTEDSLNTFTRYYDFHFAKTDCVAFRDACETYQVQSYPTLIQFKDGKEVSRLKGGRDLAEVSKWIEEMLEVLRPGTRVKGGPRLPKVGANSVETGPETQEEAKEKEDADVTPTPAAKSEATPSTKTESPKPKSALNSAGLSEPLTLETFQDKVTNTLDPWFVKFYAPWCHHCQAMQPNWETMAREMRNKINVGEVNCEVERRLCKEAGVRGYPTLLFFRGGERAEYNGLRGVGDLIDYGNKGANLGLGVQDVDAATFAKMEETEEVMFVFFYDHATTSEDFAALDRLPLSLIDKARLVKSNDPQLFKRFKITSWPRFMVSRSGKPSYYPPLAPKDTRDSRQVLEWMKTVWYPIVPELTASNAREIMDGKLVVLGILSRERADQFEVSKRELKNAALEWIDKQEQMYKLELQELRDAKQLRIEEAEDKNDQRALRNAKQMRINMDDIKRPAVGFAWVDGVFWERWIRQTYGIDVKDGERVIINDEDNKRYWDTTISGEPIRPSRISIFETVGKVVSSPPKIKAKSTMGSFSLGFFHVKNFCSAHPFVSIGLVLGLLLLGSLIGKSRMRRRAFGNTGSFFQLDGKEGLLGSGANGAGGGKKD